MCVHARPNDNDTKYPNMNKTRKETKHDTEPAETKHHIHQLSQGYYTFCILKSTDGSFSPVVISVGVSLFGVQKR